MNDKRVFQVPRDQQVRDEAELKVWQGSAAYRKLISFLERTSTAIRGMPVSSAPAPSPQVSRLLALLGRVESLLESHPPLEQPQRFGNRAFRDLHAALSESAVAWLSEALPEEQSAAAVELAPYLAGSFGNPTRLDYGTGHETAFVVLLLCFEELGLLGAPGDLVCVPLRLFDRYVRLCRAIQRRYSLEPAGSHGVWSLDDYQFLCFLWGSSQLIGHPTLGPTSVLDKNVVKREAGEYLYMAGIEYILATKAGPFFEHSPTLHNITGVVHWEKINAGMFKMYAGEVLSKVPIVQHFLFGSLFPSPTQK